MAWSISKLSNVFATSFGLIAVSVVVALVWATSLVRQTTGEVVRDTTGARLANDLERTLLSYQRMSNQRLLTADPALDAAIRTLANDMDTTLREAEPFVPGERERDALRSASRAIDIYTSSRARAEAHHADYASVIARSRPSFERALAAVERLRALYEAGVARAVRDAQRVNDFSNVLGLGGGVLLLLGLGALHVTGRRQVLVPLMEIDEAIRRYRVGEPLVVAPRGARELRALASALDDMGEAVAQQRERQLAFVAGVVHDVRNPLSGMKMALQLALEEEDPGLFAKTLAMIDRQVDRLSRMLGDLLDATRIEAGHLELHLHPVELRRAAREMVDFHAPTFTKHEIVLTTANDPVIVQGDVLRIEQVIANLLTNACKYSPQGGKIEVDVRREGDDAIIEVTDHGIGIASDRMETIFLPFRRAATEIASGAGLGLSVVRRIVTALGGDVTVESRLGEGSTFRVRLPLAEHAIDRISRGDTAALP